MKDNKIISGLDVKFPDARLTLDAAADSLDSLDKLIDDDNTSHIRKISGSEGKVLQGAYTFAKAINFCF